MADRSLVEKRIDALGSVRSVLAPSSDARSL